MIALDGDNGAAIGLRRADLAGVHHAEPSIGGNLDLATK